MSAALANDNIIPTEIIDLQEALDIANDKLVQKYGEPPEAAVRKLISENRGSSNKVEVWEKRYGSKDIRYAVRTGEFAAFKIVGNRYAARSPNVALLTEYVSNSYEKNTIARNEFLEETKNSEQNWRKANEKGLSPELYFYGYIKDGNFLTLCTISEAFNMDLAGFVQRYRRTLFANPAMQENIATQLFNLFHEMPEKMSMICFDIKPQNTVIKFDQDAEGNPILNENFVIKLIDWDADWCRDYKFLRSKDSISRDSFRKASAMAMIMVMANFFYFYYHNNILRDKMVAFYEEDVDNSFKITKVMMNLFKAGTFGGSTTEFRFMARHYFGRFIPNAESMTQEDFLFQMFKTSISRNETEFATRVRFEKGKHLKLKGGNKRKTRRKYKRKTKRVQTKKRRRKSNIKKKRKTRRKKRISKKKRNGGGLIDLWNAGMAVKNTKNGLKFYKNYFSKNKRNKQK